VLAGILLNLSPGRAKALKPWKVADKPVGDIVDIAEGDEDAVELIVEHIERLELTPAQEMDFWLLAHPRKPRMSMGTPKFTQSAKRRIADNRPQLERLTRILRQAAQSEEEAVVIAILLTLK